MNKLSAPAAKTASPTTAATPRGFALYRFNTCFNSRTLWACGFFLIAAYLASAFIYPLVASRSVTPATIAAAAPKKRHTPTPAGVKPLSYYQENIAAKPLFSRIHVQEALPGAAVESELINDIVLVGVITGQPPQAIIEEKKSRKTYYLSEGQYVGTIKIEKILEGKIILDYNGRKFELYL